MCCRTVLPLFLLWLVVSCGPPPELRFAPTEGSEAPLRANCRVLLGGIGTPFVFSFEGELSEQVGVALGDSLVPVAYRFDRFVYFAEGPNLPKVLFDSRSPEDTTVLGGLRFLVGKSFGLTMRRNATVAKALPPSDSLSGFEVLAPEIIDGLIELHAVLPNAQVRQGDQWQSTVWTRVQGLELEIPLTWHCDQVLKDKALLSFHGVCLPPAASEAYAFDSGVDVKAQGGRRGTATVDLATGRTLQFDLTDDLKVSLVMGGSTIPYTLARQLSVGR
jgi:hypothetical protein